MTDQIRVLHIVTTMNRGGLETMLMNYYRHIDRTKVQFDFLVHRDFEADYDQEITQLGGKIYHVSRLVPWSKKYQRELKKFFKQHPEYKIVHVHQDCLSSVALKCAKECGVSVRIAHSHNSNQDKNWKYFIKMHYMKQIPTYATELFACGKEAGDWMFGGYNYKILNNAINAEAFRYNNEKRRQVRKKLEIDQDEVIIGHVGRFNYQKNHEYLIDIFRSFHDHQKRSRLLLIGTGDLENKIREKVSKLNLNQYVIFLGNRKDVNELMQGMDIFVFPSHYEGLPVTLVEAQASGLPVIKSSNVPDQSIITPNVYTLSLNDRPEIWAEEIFSILQSSSRTDTLSYIEKAGYDVKRNSKWLEDFYIEEIQQHG